jgi:hypothetical protein
VAEVDEARVVEEARRFGERLKSLLIHSARRGVDPTSLLIGIERELAKAGERP